MRRARPRRPPAEAERCGDKRFGDAAGDGCRRVEFAANQPERVNHSGDRAQQAEQWRERNDRVQHGQSAIKTFQFQIGRSQQGARQGFLTMLQRIEKGSSHEIGRAFRRFLGVLHVAPFDQAEEVFDCFGLSFAPFRPNEHQPLQCRGHRRDGGGQQGPHDRPAFDEDFNHICNHSISSVPNLTKAKPRGRNLLTRAESRFGKALSAA